MSASFSSHCRMNNWSSDNENLINKQINLELFASHSYTALSAFFLSDDVGFPGIAAYFKKASDEEMEHARAFIGYQTNRGGLVNIDSLDSPRSFHSDESGDSIVLSAFKRALDLEQTVYNSILNISKTCDDPALEDFLDDFLKEQLEGQYKLGIIISQLKRIGTDGHGLYQFDKDMSS